MSSPGSSDAYRNRIEYEEADATRSSEAMAEHLEDLLDRAISSTEHRDELVGKLQARVRNDPHARLGSREQVLLLVRVALSHEFRLEETIPRIWSRTAENIASTLWNREESRSRLAKLWLQLKADST